MNNESSMNLQPMLTHVGMETWCIWVRWVSKFRANLDISNKVVVVVVV